MRSPPELCVTNRPPIRPTNGSRTPPYLLIYSKTMDTPAGNEPIAAVESSSRAPRHFRRKVSAPPSPIARIHAFRAVGWIGIAVVLIFAFRAGLSLRKWMFVTFEPVRFVFDDARAVYWGLEATGPEGYLNQYDKMEPQVPETEDSNWIPWLDYAPFRLLVMRQWAAWQRTHFPPDPGRNLTDQYRTSYEFNRPVLIFNSCMEFSGRFAVFPDAVVGGSL